MAAVWNIGKTPKLVKTLWDIVRLGVVCEFFFLTVFCWPNFVDGVSTKMGVKDAILCHPCQHEGAAFTESSLAPPLDVKAAKSPNQTLVWVTIVLYFFVCVCVWWFCYTSLHRITTSKQSRLRLGPLRPPNVRLPAAWTRRPSRWGKVRWQLGAQKMGYPLVN